MAGKDISSKRVAIVIAGGNINNKKGLHNAAVNRAKALLKIAQYQVDVYYLQEEFRLFHWYNLFYKGGLYKSAEIDGLQVKMLWRIEYYATRYYRRLLDIYYSRTGGHFLDANWLKRYVKVFKNYDLLSVHTDDGAIIAHYVYQKYRVPFCVTWHGSDIHTHPYDEERKSRWPLVTSAIEEASMNFFVSRALMNASDKLTTKGKKLVLYNGVNESFVKYDDATRQSLRTKFGVNNSKVVAFVGNLVPIKNADLLPDIYKTIKQMYTSEVVFWIIGDGPLREKIIKLLKDINVECRLWGNQPPESMPDFFNCIDVLILPSKNEGLPLVSVEALACGAKVVGSKVGGIPEVIGMDNTFDYDLNFIYNIANRVVEILHYSVIQKLANHFTWTYSAAKENMAYIQLFKR